MDVVGWRAPRDHRLVGIMTAYPQGALFSRARSDWEPVSAEATGTSAPTEPALRGDAAAARPVVRCEKFDRVR